jgi:DNA-binding MarR family transcriptional regulator
MADLTTGEPADHAFSSRRNYRVAIFEPDDAAALFNRDTLQTVILDRTTHAVLTRLESEPPLDARQLAADLPLSPADAVEAVATLMAHGVIRRV